MYKQFSSSGVTLADVPRIQIQALKRLSPHPNIITLLEVLYDEPTGRLALVFELMEMNMYEAIKGKRTPLPEQRVK